MKAENKLITGFIIALLFISFSIGISQAAVLDSWKSPLAYKPKPVLFLHGFAKGSPSSWQDAVASLREYFNKYENKGPFLTDSVSGYLELMNFGDPNGSIDTYPSGKLNPQGTNEGWADKLDSTVNDLLYSMRYGSYTKKINLVCHSMGGLAAREYLINYDSTSVDKLIAIGTPHLGANLATAANGLVIAQETIGMFNVRNIIVQSIRNKTICSALDLFAMVDLDGEAIDDMDATILGSGFIGRLNDRIPLSDVDYYGVIGVVSGVANWVLFGDYYGGDSIVSKRSQYGVGKLTYKNSVEITASHFQETNVAGSTKGRDNIILKFLDNDKPEIEITEPNPAASPISEIKTLTTRLKGKLFKEYLPADTTLKITIIRQDDNSSRTIGTDGSIKLEASDLWNCNDSSSPVAEFDEEISFSDVGTYTIKVTATNPAGISSDEKTTRVKVAKEKEWVRYMLADHGKSLVKVGGYGSVDYTEVRNKAYANVLSAVPHNWGWSLVGGNVKIIFPDFEERIDDDNMWSVTTTISRNYLCAETWQAASWEFDSIELRIEMGDIMTNEADNIDIEIWVDYNSDYFRPTWNGGEELLTTINTAVLGENWTEITVNVPRDKISISGSTTFEVKWADEQNNFLPVFPPTPSWDDYFQRYYYYYDKKVRIYSAGLYFYKSVE